MFKANVHVFLAWFFNSVLSFWVSENRALVSCVVCFFVSEADLLVES